MILMLLLLLLLLIMSWHLWDEYVMYECYAFSFSNNFLKKQWTTTRKQEPSTSTTRRKENYLELNTMLISVATSLTAAGLLAGWLADWLDGWFTWTIGGDHHINGSRSKTKEESLPYVIVTQVEHVRSILTGLAGSNGPLCFTTASADGSNFGIILVSQIITSSWDLG